MDFSFNTRACRITLNKYLSNEWVDGEMNEWKDDIVKLYST